MKRSIYLLATLLVVFLSCETGTVEETPADQEKTTITVGRLEVSQHKETYSYPPEKDYDHPTQYIVEWQEVENASPSLKDAIQNFYDISMRSYNGKLLGISALADTFFAEYATFLSAEGSNFASRWEHKEVYEIVSVTDVLFTLSKELNEYKGAGRPITNLEYINIDTRTGLQIQLNQIIPDSLVDSVNKIAADLFIDQLHVDISQGWVNGGYWFYNGFKIPNNFILGHDDITFVYNREQIAPYNKGIIQFKVPLSAIKPFTAELSDQWIR